MNNIEKIRITNVLKSYGYDDSKINSIIPLMPDIVYGTLMDKEIYNIVSLLSVQEYDEKKEKLKAGIVLKEEIKKDLIIRNIVHQYCEEHGLLEDAAIETYLIPIMSDIIIKQQYHYKKLIDSILIKLHNDRLDSTFNEYIKQLILNS